jgi:hydroxyethylthiazole kinase
MADTQKRALAARRLAKDSAKEDQGALLAEVVKKMREQGGPLVHCITNYVSMDIMANVLLAAGMSPAMVHAELEAPEFAGISSAVSINVGTLSPSWTNAFFSAAKVCSEKGTPWVLDPVGVGAISYRTDVVKDLLQLRPTVLRGNPSEILACGKLLGVEAAEGGKEDNKPRGADSSLDTSDLNYDLIDTIARKMGGTVVVTGSSDYCTDGADHRYLALHSAPGLQKVTAAGCSLGSLVGGFLAMRGAGSAALASAQACAFYTLATQEAEKAAGGSCGPGTLRVGLMDQLAHMDDETIRAMTRIERL